MPAVENRDQRLIMPRTGHLKNNECKINDVRPRQQGRGGPVGTEHCHRRDHGHIIAVVRLLAKAFLVAWLFAALVWLPAARAQSTQSDTDSSTRLTDYLHAHRLPLVGAQVLNSTGGRSVLLYGYTATEFGKTDAETKARRFLQDSNVAISNHIHVRPELSSMRSYAPSGSPSYSGSPPASGSYSGSGAAQSPGEAQSPDVDAYKNQNPAEQQYVNQQAQQYMNQGQGNSPLAGNLGSLIPLLGGLAIGIGGGSGFGMGVSPGFGGLGGGTSFGSPFGGGSPYGGYGGGSPYGSYGGGPSPYGGYPSGPSPYGAPPNPYP
jgi:hypothetical protein